MSSGKKSFSRRELYEKIHIFALAENRIIPIQEVNDIKDDHDFVVIWFY